jgi:sulfate adenylyltransferase
MVVSRPHGQKLVNLHAKGRTSKELGELRSLSLGTEEAVTISNIGDGVFSPLVGPMNRNEFESSVESMRLTNDLPWSIPVSLSVSREEAGKFEAGDTLALSAEGKAFATLKVEEKFSFDKENYSLKVFGTKDPQHPGVAKVYSSGEIKVGGKVELVGTRDDPFASYYLTPKETRVLFGEKKWKTVCAFQTRNAPHVGHEYVQKMALLGADGLFINPVIGKKKPGDFRDEVIVGAYKALLRHYYPKDSAVMSVLHYEMQYAGPREAIMHAIMRKNFGCTKIAIGRDHAGVGSYYGPYAAQEIFREFPDLGIEMVPMREFYYCRKCEGIANERICPHPEADRLTFSGTKLRSMFQAGQPPPKEFMRPEVARVILDSKSPFVE